MDQQNSLQTNQQKIKKLHSIAFQLSDRPMNPDKLLKQYISLYVESHHLSEEYFTTLCQHRFMVVLLENANRIIQSTCILQCLNLLLTNTKNQQELVYFLSQNALHQYLFGPDALQRDSEFIQYYVQLLKTILMKISEHEENRSLIRMFCNNKYPNFPLLTYTTILANDTNQLIKVTAQQCILILVGMINQRKMYQIYLCEPPMLIFIVRLATQFLKPDTDHEGICKYLADLMYQLRNNRIPLFIFSNALCNVIIVSSLPKKIHVALSFIQLLTKSIQTRVLEHKNIIKSQLNQRQKQNSYYKINPKSHKILQFFQQEACDSLIIICTTFYRILIKYMTNKYINAVYLSTFVQMNPNLNSNINQQQVEISLPLKVIYPGTMAQWKMLQDYSLKKYIDQEHSSSQIQIRLDIMDQVQNKINQYGSSKQFNKLKQNYLKRSTSPKKSEGFFGRIFNRGTSQQLNTQYMKYISDFTGINIIKGQPIQHFILKLLNPSYSVFFSEYILINDSLNKGLKYDGIKTGQQTDSVQPNQIHFNDIRSLWTFNLMNLDIILIMSRRFMDFINSQLSQSLTLVVPKMYIPPSYLFLGQLKDYLSCSIQQHINKQRKNLQFTSSMQMLFSLSKICSILNVQLTQTAYSSLIVQLTSIHQQIQTCLFENGFMDVVEYIKTKNKLALIQMQEKNKIRKLSEDQKKIKIKVKPGITFIKLGCFQSLQKIMDPHIKPLSKHFQSKWKLTFSKIPIQFQQFYQETLSSFKVSYFGKNGCILSFVRLMIPSTIVLRIDLSNKKLLQTDVLQVQSIRKNLIDNRVLQFDGNVQNVKVESTEIGQQIIQKLTSYRFMLQEYITNATLEYLSCTNQTLHLKGRKMNRTSSSRYSIDFQTPH